jgi:hypothetical protein
VKGRGDGDMSFSAIGSLRLHLFMRFSMTPLRCDPTMLVIHSKLL